MRLYRSMLWAIAVTIVIAVAFSHRHAARGSANKTRPSELLDTQSAAYPRARWRLAPHTLHQTLLSLSHIVIEHRGSRPGSLVGYEPEPEAGAVPPRSVGHARVLALELARELQDHPERFEQRAREFSSDSRTAGLGGAMGPRRASELPDEYLDAVAALEIGQVSHPIETPHGFHLVRLGPPPDDTPLSADRIVIGHRGAASAWFRSDRPTPTRTRAEAASLAHEVINRLHAQPDAYPALVATYSDHLDWQRGGYMGRFSRRHPDDPLVTEALSRVAVGELAGPIDTPWGYQILRRRGPVTGQTLGASVIRLRYDPDAEAHSARSSAAVSQLARTILEAVTREPQRWSEFQRAHCCTEPMRWRPGRAPIALEAALNETPIGGVVRSAVDAEHALWIARRLDPDDVAEADLRLSLHVPDRVDLEALVASMSGRDLRDATYRLGAAVASLGILSDRAQRAGAVMQALGTRMETSAAPERLSALRDALAELRGVLGARGFDQLMAFVQSRVAEELMSQ